jgi:hypothetical protein
MDQQREVGKNVRRQPVFLDRVEEIGKNVRPRQPIFLDRLDQNIKERIDEHKEIELSELRREYPDELGQVPYSTFHYRVLSLAQEGFIRVERGRKSLICYSIEG